MSLQAFALCPILLFFCLIIITQTCKVCVDSGDNKLFALLQHICRSWFENCWTVNKGTFTKPDASACHICAHVGNNSAVKESKLICENVVFLYFCIYKFWLLHIYLVCLYFFFPVEFFQLPTVRVLVSSAEEQETTFACFAKDFSPKDYEFKWFRNNKEVTSKIFETNTPVKEESKTPNGTLYSAASFLTVLSSEWKEEDTAFTCQLKGRSEKNGPVYVNSSVTYKVPVQCKSDSFY